MRGIPHDALYDDYKNERDYANVLAGLAAGAWLFANLFGDVIREIAGFLSR